MSSALLRALGEAALCAGLMYLTCAYGVRAQRASELELTVITSLLAFLMMLPMLRSKLIRRRLWVNSWMRERAGLTRVLQGGVIFAAYTFCLSFPWATLLVSELVNISHQQALTLSALSGVVALSRGWFRRGLHKVLAEVPASLFAREWGARLYLWVATLCLIPTILYQDRVDLKGRSLEEALLLSGVTQEGSLGVFGLLRDFVALKEVTFWWLIENINTILSGMTPLVIQVVRYGLGALYTLYAISLVYGFTRLVSALLELTDPVARRFFWGEVPLEDR